MSDYVVLSKDGLHGYKYNGDTKDYIRSRVKEDLVFTKLRCQCEIEDGTTLKDIFRMVESYPMLKAFISQYSWCRAIDEFHAQAEEPMRSEDAEDLEYLEIYVRPSQPKISVEKVKHPGGMRERTRTISYKLVHGPGFHAVGKPSKTMREQYGDNCPEVQPYSASFIPLYDIADLPVKLKIDYDVHARFPAKGREPAYSEKVGTDVTDFTLLQVLDAIYDDISFAGDIEQKVEFLDELGRRRDEALAELDEENDEFR